MDTQQLTEITTRANTRIDELFGSGQVRSLPTLTVGLVRMVLDVYDEIEREQALPQLAPAAFEAGRERLVAALQEAHPVPREALAERTNGKLPAKREPKTKPKRSYDPERIRKMTEARLAKKRSRELEAQAAQNGVTFPQALDNG